MPAEAAEDATSEQQVAPNLVPVNHPLSRSWPAPREGWPRPSLGR
jgi:hypothetical protein